MLKSENLIKVIKFGVYPALLAPLVYIPQTIFSAVFGKMIYFQIVIELALPFFLYLIIFYRDSRPKINWLSKLILIFFGLLFLSSLLGVDWSRSFWGTDERMRGLFALLHFLALYFYIITVFRAPNDKKKLLFFVIIVSILVSAYGVVERVNPGLSIDKVSMKADSGHRVISTMGNPIFLAGYLIFVCFLSFHYYLKYKDFSRWMGLGGLLLSVLVMFFTGTRGAFLGFVGGLAVIAVLLFFNTTKKKKIIIALAAAVFAFLPLLDFVADVKILTRNKYWDISRLADISLKNTDGSVNNRLLLWQLALKSFKERPFLGWGAENFDYVFDKYYNPQFYRGGISETWSDRAHNWFLDFLVMGGLAGLASYLTIFACLGIMLAKKSNRTPLEADRTTAVVAAPLAGRLLTGRTNANFVFGGLFTAFLIFSFFEIDDPSTTMMLFVAFAIFYLISDEGKRITNYELPASRIDEIKPPLHFGSVAPETSAGRRITNKRGSLLFFIFFIFIFLSVYFYNIRPLYAGIDFISFRHQQNPGQKKILAERFLSSVSPYSDDLRFRFATQAFLDAGAIGDQNYINWSLDRAAEEMETVLLHHPVDFSYFHTLGNIYLRKGSLAKDAELLDKAIGIYKKALEISPNRQATIFQLSTAYLFRGESPEAVKILKEAVLSDEKVGQSHWRLGVALLADGKREEAYQSFKNSINRGFLDKIDSELRQAAALCVQFKDYGCAVDVCGVLVERNPQDADLYAQLAAAYAAAGRYEDAKNAVIKAVQLDPSLQAEAKEFLRLIEAKK